jgi:pSer/pThr/pTyr-binding forkhead associated (FHA) protein
MGGYAPPPGPQAQYSAPPGPGQQGQQPYEPPPVQPANLPPNALRGFILAFQTNAAGEFWPLTGGRHTIGRANSGEQLDIPLADATISSKHAAINVDVATNTVTVEDRGSTNGTYVNDEHIGYSGRRDLRDGDRVRFGGFSTIVKIVSR